MYYNTITWDLFFAFAKFHVKPQTIYERFISFFFFFPLFFDGFFFRFLWIWSARDYIHFVHWDCYQCFFFSFLFIVNRIHFFCSVFLCGTPGEFSIGDLCCSDFLPTRFWSSFYFSYFLRFVYRRMRVKCHFRRTTSKVKRGKEKKKSFFF